MNREQFWDFWVSFATGGMIAWVVVLTIILILKRVAGLEF